MNLKYFIKKPLQLPIALITKLPYFKFIRETASTQTAITFETWFRQKILGFNRSAYWPVHFTSRIYNPKNIYAGIETSPGLMPNCYIQAEGKIFIGDYTQIGPSVGIISANHDLYDTRKHDTSKIINIGKYCWIGMQSVILPGVELGDFTIVGAGSVVTKSFPMGYCVIAGNPAKIIKSLEPEQCIRYRNEYEYNGYIPASRFEKFRSENLNL